MPSCKLSQSSSILAALSSTLHSKIDSELIMVSNVDLSPMWSELQFLSLLASVNLIQVNVSAQASDLASIIFQIAQMQVLPSHQIYEKTLSFYEEGEDYS